MASLRATNQPLTPWCLWQLQLEQIEAFRAEWAEVGLGMEPQVSVSRSISPISDDFSCACFGAVHGGEGGVGQIEGVTSRSGPQFVGTLEVLIDLLSQDRALAAVDTVLITIPNQLVWSLTPDSSRRSTRLATSCGATPRTRSRSRPYHVRRCGLPLERKRLAQAAGVYWALIGMPGPRAVGEPRNGFRAVQALERAGGCPR